MDFRTRTRDNVPAVAALLSVVSVALIFGAVLRIVPTALLPAAPPAVLDAIPHVNALVSTLALVTIVAGVVAIRRGRVRRHRALMLASLALFATFLVLYLYKVLLEGPSEFPGPETVRQFVYLPVLAVHILLAVICIPLLYYVLLLATTRPVSEIPRTNHRRVGRVAATLWAVSFALGDAVYVLLYVVY